uniref:beta-ketoacyl-[acyl-carrier-protein] synthase III n=1 Tax=Helicotheca tamesis TaxID=374047 RepID=A0A7S2MXG7_9STRA|mmetsp:Transcript_5216/g.7139  ORF Transcript_5216/g.7139 Transcript_5216/m.7139 type:complete len:406 (+) Transcript_5216:340-1557(+)|eukprot:CAMPEP_0185730998 /NCGR_PEP_ID=MMETSP1171-20130828/11513_1 /TAXON_ID=374046 /ORGANISM="Helicotheca tamensis, Strain CCMP826" /LENGTH=405 /DNA_ID=CAMNT_0028400153 /DNA_START=316 /DNA_END=1533 /DNA_ORIENTATION=-
MKFIPSTILSLLLLHPNASIGFHAPTAFVAPSSSRTASESSYSYSSSRLSATCGGKLNSRVIGVGSAAPSTVVTNTDLENIVETDDEWIRTRTGISERRLLLQSDDDDSESEEGKKETIKSLAADAASKALEMSELDAKDIDLVVVATSSPDDLFGDATSVAASIGATNAVAFDLTAACSGFLFATVTAGQFLDKGDMKHAIVVGADALSRWVDWDDRNTCILFGDGAGATVMSTTAGDDDDDEDGPGILGYSVHSNGNGYTELNCGYKGSARPVATPDEDTILSEGSYNKLFMNGKEVYKFATREVPTVLEEALDAAGMTVDEVDWLLLHQANIRIMQTVAKRLGMPMDKVITNLANYGNTSAASIPLALDEAVRTGQVKKGDIIACAGFGAGLSWGSAIIRWG